MTTECVTQEDLVHTDVLHDQLSAVYTEPLIVFYNSVTELYFLWMWNANEALYCLLPGFAA